MASPVSTFERLLARLGVARLALAELHRLNAEALSADPKPGRMIRSFLARM